MQLILFLPNYPGRRGCNWLTEGVSFCFMSLQTSSPDIWGLSLTLRDTKSLQLNEENDPQLCYCIQESTLPMFSFTHHSLHVRFYQNWVLLPVALIRVFTHWSLARVHYKVLGAAVGQPIHHCPQTGSERLTGTAFLETGGKKIFVMNSISSLEFY